jgi:hypothetical protein
MTQQCSALIYILNKRPRKIEVETSTFSNISHEADRDRCKLHLSKVTSRVGVTTELVLRLATYKYSLPTEIPVVRVVFLWRNRCSMTAPRTLVFHLLERHDRTVSFARLLQDYGTGEGIQLTEILFQLFYVLPYRMHALLRRSCTPLRENTMAQPLILIRPSTG